MNNNNIYFLIIGGMKCGTSSLRNYINRLEGFKTLPAEGNFFSVESEYSKGLVYYLKRFGEYSSVKDLKLGEKSVDYSLIEKVPARIKECFPEVKLIWILRDPVFRTYSNYLHELKRGVENQSFIQAINRELEGLVDFEFQYLEKSRYSKQITRVLDHFEKSQILFLSFESLISNPSKELLRVHSFFDISQQVSLAKYKDENKTVLPRFPLLARFAHLLLSEQSKLYKTVAILNTYKKKPGYPEIQSYEKQQVRDILKEEYQWMANFNKRIFESWKDQ